jgi:hypothetical protein
MVVDMATPYSVVGSLLHHKSIKDHCQGQIRTICVAKEETKIYGEDGESCTKVCVPQLGIAVLANDPPLSFFTQGVAKDTKFKIEPSEAIGAMEGKQREHF